MPDTKPDNAASKVAVTKNYVVEKLPPSQKRLDKFLVGVAVTDPDMAGVSRNQIQGWIKNGATLLNDAPARDPDQKIKAGDRITLVVPPPRQLDLTPEAMDFDIIFEDKDILVLNKPAGLTVHPSIGNWTGTLVHGLLHHCGKHLSGINGVMRPGIVHRLDKDTSGLMVIAKNDMAHQSLTRDFTARNIRRRYIALAWGRVALPATAGNIGIVNQPLGRNKNNRLQMTIVPVEKGGRVAETHYRILAQDDDVSLLECRLMTGRTHQIRAHMAYLKHPLVGDAIYGGRARQPSKQTTGATAMGLMGFPRQCLHAFELGFTHPRGGKELHFLKSPPPDMMELFDLLGFADTITTIIKNN
ncbi:MAG: RluA family pseudouridine synthase [Hydrotalea sp.]|nr:RluA family pseudouridine synthase [Hydrotalea sp.]